MTPIDQTNQTGSKFRAAYLRLSAQIEAVQPHELVPINIDVPSAVTSALGAWPEIQALRPRIVSELPSFSIAVLDQLEDLACATGHAHATYVMASSPAVAITELAAEAAQVRELLVSDMTALAKRGLLDGQKLKELKGPQGYQNLAFDVLALSDVMRKNWSRITGKTAVQESELDRAEALAVQLVTEVGLREQAPTVIAASAENRAKAFSLFVRAYDDVRRAITFLRWHERDVDLIAPSLYAGRTGQSRKKAIGDTSDVPASTGGSAQPQTSAQPDAQPAASPSPAPQASAQPALAGLPGGSPFTS
jgi:hypothetical protein